MSESFDDAERRVQVHRPPDDEVAPSRQWMFAGSGGQDKPPVPVSPALVGGVLVAVLLLALAFLVIRSVGGGRVAAEDRVYSPPSVSATPTPGGSVSVTPSPSVPATAPVTAPPPPPPSSTAPSTDPTTDPNGALQVWYDTSGLPIVEELQALVPDVQAAADARDYDALAEECAALGDISDDARSQRPPGNFTEIAADWDDAADFAAGSAADCVTASESGDTTLLASALSKSRSALSYMQDAIAAVEAIL